MEINLLKGDELKYYNIKYLTRFDIMRDGERFKVVLYFKTTTITIGSMGKEYVNKLVISLKRDRFLIVDGKGKVFL
jgi:hypothetical protein